jgi:cytochrome b6-f complex iron-sulfur subunit
MQDKKVKRRGFLKKLGLGVLGLQLGYIFWDAWKPEKEDMASKKWYDAGYWPDFQKSQVYPFQSGGFFLSIFKDKGMMAFSVKCTHLACALHIKDQGFTCPCHESKFNKYGEVMSPPANRAMDLFEVKIVNNRVLVNNQKAIRRQKFDKSQIYYAI